jgi:choline dehydrogenase-like flavoprotein
VYVLAANAIETAKLLLLSTSEATPNGAANSSDQVGRHLSDHPTMLSIAASVEPYYPYRGPLSVAGIEQLRTGDERRERSAMRIEIGNDGWSWPGFDPLGVAQQLIEEGRVGADLFRAIGERVPHQVRLASLTEQLPNPDNRVVPDEANRDALGIPRPKLTYAYDDYTVKGIAAAREAHDKLFDALGVTYRLHVEGIQGAGHLMGTHRMGADPTTSVTDADGRTHDHPNLFLAGAGLFPTTGTGNPTLTLAALALRTAATIAADLGVAEATPVASPTS